MLNETFGWCWILAGLVSGALLGLFFRRADWLGGYDSLRRRLVRLGHISFFGLGILNLLFAQSAARLPLDGDALTLASWALVVGGVAMPAACGLTAWRERLHPVFVVPVAALITGVFVICRGLLFGGR